MKYLCNVCDWEYDEATGVPEQGIAPGTKFEDLPDDFVCPLCGIGKEDFSPAE
jgi:rubredoxin-NAD+ reductase